MYESVEREAEWSQFEIVLYNQINGLCSVIRLARGAPWFEYILCTSVCRSFTDLVTWRVRQRHECFLFDQYYIYYYLVYDLI
jgi:hypothetical protein